MILMDIFLLKLLLSFLVGGTYIAFTVWLSEKYGSKLGGIAIGLPSTSLVSIIFIAWSSGTQTAIDALPIIPAGIAINGLFIIAYLFLYKRLGLYPALACAFFTWFALAISLALLHVDNMLYSILIGAIFFSIAIPILSRFPHRKLPAFHSTKREFLLRAAFAGVVVASAVLFGKIGGPLWGGIFACFPAAFSTSLVLLTKEHGIDFAASVGRAMPYGNLGTVVFAVSLFLLAAPLGFAIGLVASFLLSLISAVLIHKFMLR
jgi:hypothetical protein